MRSWKFLLFVFYIVILTTVAGCDTPPTPEVPDLKLWNSEYTHIDPECSPIYECQFIVTVGPFNREVNFDVQLHADYGVDFNVDENFPNVVSDEDRTSVVENIHLQLHETRVLRFPFTFNSQVALAGEYMVMVQLLGTDEDGQDLLVDKLRIKAFVYIGEHGNIRLMKNQSEFDAEYKTHYITANGVHYTIRLDPGERPIHGDLFVKVVANHDDYDPVLTLQSEGGVEFELVDPVAICADKGGSRILVFPFQIIEGAYQADGRYVFAILIKEDKLAPTHDILPIAVKLMSEANTHRNQWMELVYGIPASSLSTPVEENNVSSESWYSRTVSTDSAGNSENGTWQCDLAADSSILATAVQENGEQIPAVDDATIGGVHGSGDPNVDGGTPDLHPIEEFIKGQSDDVLCDNWQSFLSNEQALSLREAYQQYVIDNGVDMTRDVFVTGFRLCNGVHDDVGNVTLYGGKSYWLPTGSEP